MRLSSGEVLAIEVSILIFTMDLLKIECIIKLPYILAPVINKEVAKTKAGFLVDQDTYLHNAFFYYSYNI